MPPSGQHDDDLRVDNKLPSKMAVAAPTVTTSIGVFLLLLGYGYQSAAKDHPEVIAAMGSSVDYGMIASALVAVGGVLFGLKNHSDVKAAVIAATLAPPRDRVTGKMNSIVTLATAQKQATIEGDDDLVADVAAALKKARGRKRTQAGGDS